MNALSVILHCDLDCFYAQVERERLNLPKDAAVVVVQWTMALAVSYPARKFGIKRGSTIQDIRRLAGDAVTIVHVETISTPSSNPTSTPTPASDHTVIPSAPAPTSLESIPDPTARASEKVSLARYRSASARVFSAMTEALSGLRATIERASIDEAFIDVTIEVERRVRAGMDVPNPLPPSTHVISDRLDTSSESDLRLAHGASIAADIRRQVALRCAFSMSAGVSANKLLAKFASARHKPDQQTIVPVSAVASLMHAIPLTNLRGLGGKLGRMVEALGVQTAGQAVGLSMETLVKAVGEKSATFVYNCVRGIDESPVCARALSKSLLAAKSFPPEASLRFVEDCWVPLLADELADRLQEDCVENERDAGTLTVGFRAALGNHTPLQMVSASRSSPMPQAGVQARRSAITELAIFVLRNVFGKEGQFTFPISFVGLTACNFSQRVRRKERISNFFDARVGGEEGGEDQRSPGSVRDSRDAHKRRLQEKADRDLALRLHRQESFKGVRKAVKKAGSSGQGKGHGLSSTKMSKGGASVDNFFKKPK